MHPIGEFSTLTKKTNGHNARNNQWWRKGECREWLKKIRRDWGVRTGYGKKDKKNLPTHTQKPTQSTPTYVPPTALIYVEGGKRAKRDHRASKNGRLVYTACVVTGDPIFDIGHFKPKSGQGGHDNMSNLIAVCPSINRLMGDTKRPVRCTFYRAGFNSLLFVLEPELATNPYYKRYHNKKIKLNFPTEYQPGNEELTWHNEAFEKFCLLTSTNGGSHETVPEQSRELPATDEPLCIFLDELHYGTIEP